MNGTCPACGIGHLTEITEPMKTEWEGRTGEVTLHSSICDTCKSEVVNSQQATANKIAILEFRHGR